MVNKMDEVRTFYWYFRPIAIASCTFGVLPLQNIWYKNGSKLRFRFLSIPQFYSMTVFWGTCYTIYYYSGLVFLKNKYEIGFIWRCVVIYLLMGRSLLCFIYCTTHAKQFTKLIQLLELFDLKKTSLLSIKENYGKKRFFLWTIAPLMSGTFFLLLAFYELSKISESVFNATIVNEDDIIVASNVFGVLGLWQITPLLLYIYFVSIIRYNLLDVLKVLKSRNLTIKGTSRNVDCIKNARHLYTLTTAAVRKISDIFGGFLAVDQFCLITMFVVNIYVFFFTTNQDIHLLICTILNAFLLTGVVNISNEIRKIGEKILSLLERCSTSACGRDEQAEIRIFLLQAAIHPIEISAADYFKMDRTQIPSIFSSVATYIIVLVQLSPQLGSPQNTTIT